MAATAQVYRSSRAKLLIAFFGSAVFTVGGAFMIADDTVSRFSAWTVASFFGVCTIVFAATILRPFRLVADEAGFTLSGGTRLRPKTIPWTDVERFFVYKAPGRFSTGRFVGYNLTENSELHSTLSLISRPFGANAGLPGNFECDPDTLAAELNELRAEYSHTTS